MASDPRVIVIEGLIGSGKTTFIKYLRKTCTTRGVGTNMHFVEEPVDKFMNYKTYNPLKELETSPFAAQYHFIQCLKKHFQNLMQQLPRGETNTIVIIERSVDSPMIFTEALYRNGNITCFEKDLLSDIFQDVKNSCGYPKPDAIFYLTTPPDLCMQRVEKRNRSGEEEFVNRRYLDCLQTSYEIYLNQLDIPLRKSRSGTDDMKALHCELEELIHNV